MFVYSQLSRRGIRLPLPRNPVVRVLLVVAAVALGLVVAAIAVLGALLLTVWAFGRTLLRGARPRSRVAAPDVVSPRERHPVSRDRSAEDVRFRELP